MTVVLPGSGGAVATGLRHPCLRRVNHPGFGSGVAGGSSGSIFIERGSPVAAGATDSGCSGAAARGLRQKASWASQAISLERNRVKFAFCWCQLELYNGTKQRGLKRKAADDGAAAESRPE